VRYRKDMDLPVMPPVAPMLAKPGPLPDGDGWLFDPKWDGFRSIAFRDGDELVLGSRNEKPLTRYFPEIVNALIDSLPDKCVIDGEIIIESDGVLDFDALQQRIHPADSRVRMLAEKTPAQFVVFDMLALGDEDLRSRPLVERRARMLDALCDVREKSGGRVHVTPATLDRAEAVRWFDEFEGAGCDGIIAKRLSDPYTEDKRIMIKVKHQRTADCVVAGFRWHKSGGIVGSLLLGLYDDQGSLQHVGVTASFTAKRRAELVAELEPYLWVEGDEHPWQGWIEHERAAAEKGQRVPGAVSRWNAKKDLTFVPLRAELVCEVGYAHMQGDRFRHASTFVRWRSDRTPHTCTYDQLEVAEPALLQEVLRR
jgi:ATP-dependent DNA ligase